MEFAHDAHRDGYERVRGYMRELYGDRVEETADEAPVASLSDFGIEVSCVMTSSMLDVFISRWRGLLARL